MAAEIEAGSAWKAIGSEMVAGIEGGFYLPSKGKQHFFDGEQMIYMMSQVQWTSISTQAESVILDGQAIVHKSALDFGGLSTAPKYSLMGDGSSLVLGEKGTPNYLKVVHKVAWGQ